MVGPELAVMPSDLELGMVETNDTLAKCKTIGHRDAENQLQFPRKKALNRQKLSLIFHSYMYVVHGRWSVN